ncbi:sulfite reductase subunit alpha [Methylocapsa palsarum]|uniref:assimilatory sulfite reductase (NADPH) n=1 Tax=Methylocapsa palsarum TaxID=1612308 RepID=A0A1I3YPB2_9HYPH|nr:sulfite reductase subunit alpha [Methylocapsa palsarum]SFK33199.1 sulfite reductase (NADPH) flavoprotein alpha-component [Methylocapsa palsarum]
MSVLVTPPGITPMLPESAPFSDEQRAWLNGFFAGLYAPDPARDPTALAPLAEAPQEEEAPWHDPAMALDERMKLAEGLPLRRRMMAAMAQQDCGQCGYLCETYAEAIAAGAESRLNLCAPGEKQTARALKALAEELAGAPGAAAAAPQTEAPSEAASPHAATAKPGYAREAPVEISFLSRGRLNKESSEKSTYHIEFDLSGSGLEYCVGDSLGVFPRNDPALVDAVIAALHAPQDFPIAGHTLREVLLSEVSLGSAPDSLFELISYVTGGERRKKAKSLARGEDPDGDAETLDVLAAIEKFPGIRPDPEAFVESLDSLQPRLYSISSSPKADPARVSLTVDHVRYAVGARVRRGVASSWLAEDLHPGARFRAYIQRAHNFALPQSPDTPIIMVGPGTGIAPFRAFLHERRATRASGGAWLFFGHQRRDADFFYEDELGALSAEGALSKLSLAWSRDAGPKTYVQDKMREEGLELWTWLDRGGHFYICGDAKRMAADVEKALIEIVGEHGRKDPDAARAFVQQLKKTGRYQADVY